MMKKKISLVCLGGVKTIGDIPVFLFNMFNDRHILPLKQPLRMIVSLFIMFVRIKSTYSIYKKVKSPVFDICKKQSNMLKKSIGSDVNVFFNYSKPFLTNKNNYICIPLYGFYSHTTYGSVLEQCYKTFPPFCIFPEFFDLVENKIKRALKDVPDKYSHNVSILLSAHSLPYKLARSTSDPYKNDLEIFVAYLKKRIDKPIYLSYQSKLGPIEWFKPSTEDMIKKISLFNMALIIMPISFVCDNTETVYEIDIKYKNLAHRCGIKYFKRIDCFNDSYNFMKFLSLHLKEW